MGPSTLRQGRSLTLSAECAAVGFFRARKPQETPLYRLVEALYDKVKGSWEERFEQRYGFWRGFADGIVNRYLDCGRFEAGFARVFCRTCQDEFLVALSCRRRGFCPSCGAKRAAEFGAFLRDEVLEQVAHRMWTLSIPRMIRPYFLHHRYLLGKLCRAAYETVHEMMTAAAVGADGFRTGMVVVAQSAGDLLNPNPHLHAIVPRGGWDPEGIWVPVPYVDTEIAERVFRAKVLTFLKVEGLLSEERERMLLSWNHHTGFSVHYDVIVEPEDGDAVERLARYLVRPPVSLERMRWDQGADTVVYTRKAQGAQPGVEEHIDALDFLARVIAHIPEPRLHLVHYMGWYSNVARGRRRKGRDPQLSTGDGSARERPDDGLSPAHRQARRRAWARLIQRVYETSPLTCRRCGSEMEIISVILDTDVIDKILNHLSSKGIEPGRGPPGKLAAVPF